MENFVINNPTVLHFGKNVISKLPAIAKLYGKKALLVIGQGSVIKNGIYDEVISLLKKANIEIIEYNGIKPNPVYNDVDIAAKIAKEEKVDFIIAVGGGSVIDSAKMISITTFVENSVWDFYENKIKPLKALPLIAVLTIAATGTEMNCFAVLQNNETLQKEGYAHPLIYPKHSFLDPQYTFSVPLAQTSYGIVDLIAHCLEYFFGEGDSPMSDKIAIATIAEAIECAPTLLSDLYNYELRARIMYAATIALNGWNSYGKIGADWGVHNIGHVLSLICDIPHGASLSIAYIAWLKYHSKKASDKIQKLGHLLYRDPSIENTINNIEQFFKSIGCPINFKEANIDTNKYSLILNTMLKNKVGGEFYKLSEEDITNIFYLMSA